MKLRMFASLSACTLFACAAAAFARNPPPPPHPTSLAQAVKQVQHQTGGHILAADTVSRGRTQVYRIKVLKRDGKVQVVQLHSSPQPQGRPDKPEHDQGGH